MKPGTLSHFAVLGVRPALLKYMVSWHSDEIGNGAGGFLYRIASKVFIPGRVDVPRPLYPTPYLGYLHLDVEDISKIKVRYTALHGAAGFEIVSGHNHTPPETLRTIQSSTRLSP